MLKRPMRDVGNDEEAHITICMAGNQCLKKRPESFPTS